jgi:hypothetical protein
VVFQPCDVQVCAVYGYCDVLGCSPVLEMILPILTVCVCVSAGICLGCCDDDHPAHYLREMERAKSKRDGGRHPLRSEIQRTRSTPWPASSENAGHNLAGVL